MEFAMAGDKHPPHSLRDRSADQIRNAQRGGAVSPVDPQRDAGPEANATLRRVGSQPGGEADSYRNAMVGAGGNADEAAAHLGQDDADAGKDTGGGATGRESPRAGELEGISTVPTGGSSETPSGGAGPGRPQGDEVDPGAG
jgi:hypothetical protein